MTIKVVYCKSNIRESQIQDAIKILNGAQNYFYFNLCESEDDLCKEDVLSWNSLCQNYRIPKGEYLIYITEKCFDDNWFSHENNNFSVITICDWEVLFAPPSMKCYIVYQIAQSALCFAIDCNERMLLNIEHTETQGCMFDFCQNKQDIKIAMVAGTICPKCKSELLKFGCEEIIINAVEKILSYVRCEAIGRPLILKANDAFIIMPFSQNDDNDNAYRYGIKAALDNLDIKCVRADNNVNNGSILEKIKTSIKQSRFIIAKIDSVNLNVYFELGYAMGLDKDVLLISEESFISELPTDLKNLECLTYKKGNYEDLKTKIIEYYRDNYHFAGNKN